MNFAYFGQVTVEFDGSKFNPLDPWRTASIRLCSNRTQNQVGSQRGNASHYDCKQISQQKNATAANFGGRTCLQLYS